MLTMAGKYPRVKADESTCESTVPDIQRDPVSPMTKMRNVTGKDKFRRL
jgi:hypothetical protein